MSSSRVIPIQFGTRLATHVSGPLTQELLENLYLELAPPGAKSKYILLGTPGLAPFCQPASGMVRGLEVMGPYVYAVIGQALYQVDEFGASVEMGTIDGSARVSMANNGTHLWIASETKTYWANIDDGVNEHSGFMFHSVFYQDGYLIGVAHDQSWWLSGLDDATTIDGLDFTTADAKPGLNVGGLSSNRLPLIFKTDSIEAYYNSGAAAFPFTRSQVIEKGCLSGRSIAQGDEYVFWLGNDLKVYAMRGYSYSEISDETAIRIIEAEASPETGYGFCYQQDGHTFYVLTFSGVTLVYDLKTQLWHKRRSADLGNWRVSSHVWVERWKKHIVGDYSTGDIYTLDMETYDDNGDTITRRAQGAPIWSNGQMFRVDEFDLDIESGVGLIVGQGSDPQVILDWSSTGGRTWSNELWRSFGQVGQYDLPVRWHRLGIHRQFTPRITITDPVPVRISGAYARIEAHSA